MKIILLCLLLCGTLCAAEIGRPAPQIEPGPMLKGVRPDWAKLKGKKILVLHFWKTQCPACEKAVTMLNEMAAKHWMKASFIAIGTDLPDRLKKEPYWQKFSCPVMSDALHKNQAAFLDKNCHFPADAVIDRDGTLLWIGSTTHLPEVLNAMVNGKFDRARAVDTSRFNQTMKRAMDAKDYRKALETIRARREQHPEDLELCVGEAKILAVSMRQTEQGLKVLDEAIRKNPKVYPLYSEKLNILQHQNGAEDQRVREVYQEIAKVFADRPMLLVQLSGTLMQQRAGAADLFSVYRLAHTAYHSKNLKSGPEHGLAAAALARSYYYVGMLPEAVRLQTEAVRDLQGMQEKKRALVDLRFYRNAAAAEQEIRKLESQTK